MTNAEALAAALDGIAVSAASIEKVFTDNHLEVDDDYEPENEEAIDRCAIQLLCKPLPASVSEGGYSITNSKDQIALVLNYLCSKWGVPNPTQPRVRNQTNRW